MIYDTFAEVYDQLMDQDLYDDWLDYVKQITPPTGQKVLELAGGSGALALKMQQAGYDVSLLDLSAEMLTLASKKLTKAGITMRIIQADMRDFGVVDQFDLVTCFDDSICYMQNKDDVRAVFRQVNANLKPGGRFMFDAHSLYQMDEVFPGYMYNYQTEDFAFLWSSYEGEVPHSAEHDLTFFVYNEDIDAYKPLIEQHKERTYPSGEFIDMLQECGFTDIKLTADFGRNQVKPDSVRWFFSAVKA
ncbi:methyltransferase domain-containing protein [Lacticaseibacillus pabuli]|uniref:Methyltransferase domain-containing protein n=1 Tax=Lacticaseibacillus pabuli TaxID=3025672 RepID=A0ABY7WUU1_9LACO|nr:class I SAM-dependent methyltransferase [Lacticaseibacillus sp. KACC 23028]WDF83554.1 methyltransferase domain-containing protein [Lacticaseibacillus sp. KACC 23028]